jgi:Na+-translocating ferredoxin:NAD+ oxidoreductase RnfC subunit
MNIAERVKQCGVVGAGGAGFPTHVKLQARADTLVVNGAECEPLLGSDKFLMERESEKLIRGTGYIMRSCGAARGYIALKEKYAEAIRGLHTALGDRDDIELFILDDVYPAGDELVLVHEITGRIVPEGGIPPDVGCIACNVETVINICAAVEEGRAVTSRYLSCTGEVKTPSIVNAHIGTSLREIIELCGGPTVGDAVVVLGGPMMGSIETDLGAPVTKTTSALIVLPRDHPVVQHKTTPMEFIIRQCKAACCQCTYCTELCPRYLLGHDIKPHMIMRQIGYGLDIPEAVIQNALLCSGCGLCEAYACVMGLSPQVVNKRIREKFAAAGFKPEFSGSSPVVHEMRNFRQIPTGRIQERLRLQQYYERGLRKEVHTDPDRVEILLRQHIGGSAHPTVQQGDRVKTGTLIAEMVEDGLGSSIHASIDGIVSLIDGERIIIEKRG